MAHRRWAGVNKSLDGEGGLEAKGLAQIGFPQVELWEGAFGFRVCYITKTLRFVKCLACPLIMDIRHIHGCASDSEVLNKTWGLCSTELEWLISALTLDKYGQLSRLKKLILNCIFYNS